jgi:methylenetetrahydrofolate dehydrogenase (NADP+)/methenyltetrahydrofolate cyclohydrolase
MVQILDGKKEAELLSQSFHETINLLKDHKKITPTLAVILVGDNPASHLYVRRKQEKAESLGVDVQLYKLPSHASQEALHRLMGKLNKAPAVHGILLQLPLPLHLNRVEALSKINPLKDVDGLTPENIGLFNLDTPRFIPCTPQGCLHLIHLWKRDLRGLTAIVVGRSPLVGAPMAKLLLNCDATVIQAHAHTKNLSDLCKLGDILVVAVGKPHLIRGEWVKKGACVIDVGINSTEGEHPVGDVDFEGASRVAAAISPVPGGVGPLTIMFLMSNVIRAAQLSSLLKK